MTNSERFKQISEALIFLLDEYELKEFEGWDTDTCPFKYVWPFHSIRNEEVQALLKANNMTVIHRGIVPHTWSGEGLIVMPHPKRFKSYNEYLSVVLHEAVHTTAGLLRPELDIHGNKFHKTLEEVIAELASYTLMKLFGLNYDLNDTLYYLNDYSMRHMLADDCLYEALPYAVTAVEYLTRRG